LFYNSTTIISKVQQQNTYKMKWCSKKNDRFSISIIAVNKINIVEHP